jgi:hypothetical protein
MITTQMEIEKNVTFNNVFQLKLTRAELSLATIRYCAAETELHRVMEYQDT